MRQKNQQPLVRGLNTLWKWVGKYFRPSDYVVIGSAAAVWNGYGRTNDDIDIVVRNRERLWELVGSEVYRVVDTESGKKIVCQPFDRNDTSNFDFGFVDSSRGNCFSFEEAFELSEVAEYVDSSGSRRNFRVLGLRGLEAFYCRLYPLSGKDKHRRTLIWALQKNRLSEGHTDTYCGLVEHNQIK